MSASAIAQELRSFRELGSVLYIAAHPDDENTRLIAYLARERGYRTGYLSLTRGDGGQNLIGPELGPTLGVIRTHELLAARRVDGGRQFFTRAIDFGFSKNYEETLRIWDRDGVLADMVRVIRTFRPDVLITRFSPQPGRTHGHHTASAVLAVEAFKLAADPDAFRDQLGHLPPWQPHRVLWNNTPFGGQPAPTNALQIEVGGFNPLLGESYGEIAARSRSQHSSQGMGSIASRGSTKESFQLLAGAPADNDIMDGVVSSWSRLPGGAEIANLAERAFAEFNASNPAASVPALLELRRRINALPSDPLVADKREQLDRIIVACLGLYVETVVESAEVLPGDTLKLRHIAIARNRGQHTIRWTATRYPSVGRELLVATELPTNENVTRESSATIPSDAPVSQPYWLRLPPSTGMFTVSDPALIGSPDNPPALPIEHVFEIAGETIAVPDAPVQVVRDPARGEIRHALNIVSPIALRFVDELALLAPGATQSIDVELTATRSSVAGSANIEAPTGWTITPASQTFTLAHAGDRTRLKFNLTAPAQPSTATLTAAAKINDAIYREGRVHLRYTHIPEQLLQPAARLSARSFDVAIRARKIGYLPGAGDAVPAALTRLGCAVTELSSADLTRDRLAQFDAVVLGIRALNTRADLAPRMSDLFAYAEAGGTVVVQYNNANGLQVRNIAPYPLKLSSERVTDEQAPPTFLATDHPVLNSPNKITPADFGGWVQERGLYFPNEWSQEFTPIIGFADPGEPSRSGALLVARHGKGWFVYTGLSFFRELPEGVPGAYRLFANIVSLGKPSDVAAR